MATTHQHALRDAIGVALQQQQWEHAGEFASQLRNELLEVLRDRSSPDRAIRDAARSYHRSGLYRVGFQHFLTAPDRVRDRLQTLNETLGRFPLK